MTSGTDHAHNLPLCSHQNPLLVGRESVFRFGHCVIQQSAPFSLQVQYAVTLLSY